MSTIKERAFFVFTDFMFDLLIGNLNNLSLTLPCVCVCVIKTILLLSYCKCNNGCVFKTTQRTTNDKFQNLDSFPDFFAIKSLA